MSTALRRGGLYRTTSGAWVDAHGQPVPDAEVRALGFEVTVPAPVSAPAPIPAPQVAPPPAPPTAATPPKPAAGPEAPSLEEQLADATHAELVELARLKDLQVERADGRDDIRPTRDDYIRALTAD